MKNIRHSSVALNKPHNILFMCILKNSFPQITSVHKRKITDTGVSYI